jgi:hypothetical protein
MTLRRGYGSYDDLLADDAIDVVYVSTPHACTYGKHGYRDGGHGYGNGKHT